MRKTGKQRRFIWLASLLIMAMAMMAGCGNSLSLPKDLPKVLDETAKAVYNASEDLTSQSVGGEWALLGVKDSGIKVDSSYSEGYLSYMKQIVKQKKGVLSKNQPTDYARAVIGIKAAGGNPVDFEGHNLVKPLDDFEAVTGQGINAVDYAIIASKYAGATLTNEKAYIDAIIKSIESGEFEKDKYAADYMAMALEALSLCEKTPEVEKAVDKALKLISDNQQKDGSMGNSESTSEVIVGLCQLNIDVFKDSRFIKDGKTLADGLMEYRLKDGRFCHTLEKKEADGMATEKALLALDAMKLQQDGSRIYK